MKHKDYTAQKNERKTLIRVQYLYYFYSIFTLDYKIPESTCSTCLIL